jgi:glycosyltransferase involved in cell wall biosynthesis
MRPLASLYGRLHALKLRIGARIVYLSEEQRRNAALPEALQARSRILPMCVAPAFRRMPDADVERLRGSLGVRPADFAYVGRIDARKGLDDLFGALRRVPRGRLLLIGSGDSRTCGALRRRAAALHVAERVRFLGALPQECVSAHLNCAAFLVLPSWAETFGAVIPEAWACGRPVVTTDLAAPAALVRHAGGGLVCRLGDAADLAAKINALHDDPAGAARMGDAGRRFVRERFTYPGTARALDDLYREACHNA